MFLVLMMVIFNLGSKRTYSAISEEGGGSGTTYTCPTGSSLSGTTCVIYVYQAGTDSLESQGWTCDDNPNSDDKYKCTLAATPSSGTNSGTCSSGTKITGETNCSKYSFEVGEDGYCCVPSAAITCVDTNKGTWDMNSSTCKSSDEEDDTATCSSSNLSACTTKTTCFDNGGRLWEQPSGSGGSCKSNTSSTYTLVTCPSGKTLNKSATNCKWAKYTAFDGTEKEMYSDDCCEASSTSTCISSNLSACTTEETCKTAFGEDGHWYNGTCNKDKKKIPNISVTASPSEGVKGSTGKFTVSITNVEGCKGTIRGDASGLTVTVPMANFSGNYTGKEYEFTATGNGGTTGTLTITYIPEAGSTCAGGTGKGTFEIKVSENDDKLNPGLKVSPTSITTSVGDSSKSVRVTSNAPGTITIKSYQAEIATPITTSATFSENEAKVGTYKSVTIKGIKKGTATFQVSFTPTDATKYISATQHFTVNVVEIEGHKCYACTASNGTIDREWATGTNDLSKCTNGWKEASLTYDKCTDVDGKCYRCNHSGAYKWTIENLSSTGDDSACPSGWAFVKYTNDESSCKSGGSDSSNNDDGNSNGGGGTNNGGSDNGGSNTGGSNTNSNPQTGNIMIFVVWIIGFAVVGYSFWYFKQTSHQN